MNLLTNAIESIRVGVEDYEDGSHGRLLAAVRSIHAGILLLYKEALRRLSPPGGTEALMKAKIVPTQDAQGNVQFVGDGRKTVDVQQIRERFDALGIVTDWTRFDRITNVRNDIEHYYTKANKKALESLVSDAFVVIRNFITTELEEDPLELLGDETWQAMLKVSEVYEAERAECKKSLDAVDWGSSALSDGVLDLVCPSCSGSLLRPEGDYKRYRDDMVLQCRACGKSSDAQDFVPRAIENALGEENYLAYKDGGEIPYTDCPECGAKAYVMDEQRCALCGEAAEHTCARCGGEIPAEELLSSPFCGWCAHMMAKDD
jgi:ribosomal protein L37E